MPEITMPRLSDSMEEGLIVRWLKADGDQVERNEPIVEIETDKATMEYEADSAGPLSIVAAEGATVAVGAVIGYVGAREAVATPATAAAPVAVATPVAARPVAAPNGNGHETGQPHGIGNAGSASPLAKRMAAALGVDLGNVTGTGRNGRILKADVRLASKQGAAVVAPTAPADAGGARGGGTSVPLSRVQTTVARRMAEAKATVPDFWTSVDVDMTAVLELRAQLTGGTEKPPSINDFIVAATARALRRHPRVNGAYRDGAFEQWERVNVGVAVATEGGLVVPTVFDADRAGIGHIAGEVRRLAERVRAGTVTPPELSGGTFTVSNLGMFGVGSFGGIINAPQAGILCVGAVQDRPWAVDGEVVVRPVATLTLVADHRILYGADSAQFLASIAGLLTKPVTILV